jgi:hypothetical protein
VVLLLPLSPSFASRTTLDHIVALGSDWRISY